MELVVDFSDSLPDVSSDTRERLLKALQEVAASLTEAPNFSVVWDSIEAAPLQLDLDGWRFLYTVSRERARLTVIEHKHLKDIDPIAARLRSRR